MGIKDKYFSPAKSGSLWVTNEPITVEMPSVWFCSEFAEHGHRWRWVAWLCGWWQYAKYLLEGVE